MVSAALAGERSPCFPYGASKFVKDLRFIKAYVASIDSRILFAYDIRSSKEVDG
jgi:hypothetical protein